jgi:hypothetical protein
VRQREVGASTSSKRRSIRLIRRSIVSSRICIVAKSTFIYSSEIDLYFSYPRTQRGDVALERCDPGRHFVEAGVDAIEPLL